MSTSSSTLSTVVLGSAPSVIWGDFALTDGDVAELRAALIPDCPDSSSLTDDEVRQMGYDTIHFIALVSGLIRAPEAASS